MKYTGGCHCGNVKYEVEADIDSAMSCNCSICSKKGSLLAFVPVDRFKLLKGENSLSDYRFNKKVIHHLFCKNCGIGSFSRGIAPDGGEMVAVNIRCLNDVAPDSFAVKAFNGRDL